MSNQVDAGAPRAVDVLVVGAGIGGLSAVATAARAGAVVAVVEKLPAMGGSAALSAGMFWTAPDHTSLKRRIPLGNHALGTRMVDGYDEALAEIKEIGVRVADEPTANVMTFGRGYSIDIAALLSTCAETVTRAGGYVLVEHSLRRLLTDGGRVRGAEVRRGDGSLLIIEAPAVVLATGGFQGARDQLTQYLGRNADHLILRSNPGSVGDGLRTARAAGAGGTTAMHSFYGHRLPFPMDRFESEDYLPLTQYHSSHSVLVDQDGRRFVDESLGDEIANQALLDRPEARGVLIFDTEVRRTHGAAAPFPGVAAIDRFEAACANGARTATASTLDELADVVAGWGIDSEELHRTLATYAAAASEKSPRAGGVAMPAAPNVPTEAPFHAVEVRPSITFTFGGLPITSSGQVLDADGVPVPGLFAAGVDVGGISNGGYAGGLAPSYITGRWAGAAATAERENR
ncbi:MAG: FAD-binding protein [Pseudonocardia sp.]|nr:FAD-binding protein [Pseudonocardia sp.]